MLYKNNVHIVSDNKEYIGLDINSSTVFVVDELGKKILSKSNPENRDEIVSRMQLIGYQPVEIAEAINEFNKVGLISHRPIETPIDEAEDKVDENVLGGVSLSTSHNCNMNCGYCFGGGGTYNGPIENMSTLVAKKAIDYLHLHRGNRSECFISFFGGEPLMNWRTLKESVLYAEKKSKNKIHITYFITTNATLLTHEHLKFLDQFDVRLVVSIDGPDFIHDKERKLISGAATHNIVRDNIKKLSQYHNIIVQARPTITPYASNFVELIYRHIISDLGIKRVHARSQSAYGQNRGLNRNEVIKFAEGIEETAKWMTTAARDGEHIGIINVLKYMNMFYFRTVRQYHCGGGTSVLSVAPNGTIYPCPRFTGEQDFVLGNIVGGEFNNDRRLIFFRNGVLRRQKCINCWARYICAGGCYYMHWKKHGNIFSNDDVWCELTKREIEIAMKTYAQITTQKDSGQSFFDTFPPTLPSEFIEER